MDILTYLNNIFLWKQWFYCFCYPWYGHYRGFLSTLNPTHKTFQPTILVIILRRHLTLISKAWELFNKSILSMTNIGTRLIKVLSFSIAVMKDQSKCFTITVVSIMKMWLKTYLELLYTCSTDTLELVCPSEAKKKLLKNKIWFIWQHKKQQWIMCNF